MTFLSLLDAPLSEELCQRIDLKAQYAMLCGQEPLLPALMENAQALVEAAELHGVNACIRRTSQIKDVYRGVTTKAIMMIKDLYCSRLCRSIKTVAEITRLLAHKTGVEPICDEAVWSICAYLADLREQQTSVTIAHLDTSWAAVPITLPVRLEVEGDAGAPTAMMSIVDMSINKLLAFRTIDSSALDAFVNLALYDAIALNRRPSAEDHAGVAWRLPKTLLIDRLDKNGQLEKACAAVRIGIASTSSDALKQLSAVQATENLWASHRERFNRVLPLKLFELLFDRSLFTLQAFEPRHQALLDAEAYRSRRGFSQDPASLLPALRWLLPSAEATVIGGSIAHGGLHYSHDLLELWPDHLAQIRVSAESEARAWVYFDDEIICEASAMELRRKDGTLRPHR